MYKNIGKNIKECRIQKNISQLELAKKANISLEYMSKIERCKRLPSLITFITIANILNVPTDQLLKNTENYNIDSQLFILKDLIERFPLKTQRKIINIIMFIIQLEQE